MTPHLRRSNGKLGRKIVLALNTQLTVKKSDFLLSNHNKQAFLLMLGNQLSDSGINVHAFRWRCRCGYCIQCPAAGRSCIVTLVGEDTDLLILLLWHYNSSVHHPVYLYSNTSKTAFDIKKSRLLMSDELTQSILTIHALCGCDTVSRLHSVGSRTVLQNFLKNQEFRNLLKILTLPSSERQDILQAGEKMLLLLLGAKRENNLDELRSRKYFEKISGPTRQAVEAEALGPTSDAAQQHVLRMYYQVQEWRGDNVLDPLSWGWQMTKQGMMPIEMTKPIAPPELLKIIKCGCKTDCTRKNCSCRQYGVVCTNICSGCRGVSCLNCEPINDTEP